MNASPDRARRTERAERLEQVPDRRLVELARAGDRRALESLLRRHHDRLRLLCRRLCADVGDAEDATQNTLIAIVRGLPRFDDRAEFTTWSYRVATNACLDELRRRGRRPVAVDTGHADRAVDAMAARAARPGVVDPADAAVTAEDHARLQVALASLEESFRVPVVLRDVADLDYAEIAELLDLPPGTVRSRISRGRAKLAMLLELGNHSEPVDVRRQDAP